MTKEHWDKYGLWIITAVVFISAIFEAGIAVAAFLLDSCIGE